MTRFRNLLRLIEGTDITTKPLIVLPIVFLVPIALLGCLWLGQVNGKISYTEMEIAGLRTLYPVLHSTALFENNSQLSLSNLKEIKDAKSSFAQRIDAVFEFEELISIIQRSPGNRIIALPAIKRLIHKVGNSSRLNFDGDEIRTSIGIAVAADEVVDSDHLLQQADMALYLSKSEGRGTFRFFEQEMDDRMHARLLLETDLKAALANEKFVLHDQPLVSLSSRAIVGFEALIRWHHPTRGFIGPDQFIPLAEETDLIVSLGDWVIQKACEVATCWPSNIRVAINLSPIQLENPTLIRTIDRALNSTGLDPHRLDVEITENTAISQSQTTHMILYHIRERGIKITRDDFSTGYTSLGVLQYFPFSHIKIDRSFIRNLNQHPERAVIVRAISEMAEALGMETTAEGVETFDELIVAQRNGCSEA